MTNINRETLLALISELLKSESNNTTAIAKSSNEKRLSNCIGKYCIIKTYPIGVCFCKVKEILGQGSLRPMIAIENARTIHNWEGEAHSLEAFRNILYIANNGITKGRLSTVVPYLEIEGVDIIIPCSEKSEKQFLTFSEDEYEF